MILSPNIDENELTGPISTEIGLLTELTWLRLGKQVFSVVLFCFETKPTNSMLLTLPSVFFCHKIVIDDNEFVGSVPTEVGLLTKLEVLTLDGNKFEGSIPSAFNSLTLLEYLYLGE